MSGLLSQDVVGTIIFGDLNAHHVHWLKSTETTTSGSKLYDFCKKYGFSQMVREPTRENNCLDVFLTDKNWLKSEVLPGISDHKLVFASAAISVPDPILCKRDCWKYDRANWAGLLAALCNMC